MDGEFKGLRTGGLVGKGAPEKSAFPGTPLHARIPGLSASRPRVRRRRTGLLGGGRDCRNAPSGVSFAVRPERYRSGHNGTDSKSVGAITAHVGSNPTLSAIPPPPEERLNDE